MGSLYRDLRCRLLVGDWSSNLLRVATAPANAAPVVLDGWTTHMLHANASLLGAATASTAWPANNKAYFYPVTLNDWVTVYQMFFYVGATSSGNIDVGIYDSQKNKIITSGSTAMSATINTIQTINTTDTVLPPGEYLVAGACSTTGGTCFRCTNIAADEIFLPSSVAYEQTTALALPDPCNPVPITDASPGIWSFGAVCTPVF